MATYDNRLRKLGYMVRTGSPAPLLTLLDMAGSRMRPMNRLRPLNGTWIGACPFCAREDRLYVEPGMVDWMTTCGCSVGGSILELHAALLLQALAA